jgi:hypothetical protein
LPVAAGLALAVVLVLGSGCGQGTRPDDPKDDPPDGSVGTLSLGAEYGWGSTPDYRLAWAVQAGGEYNGDWLGDLAWSVAFAPDGSLFFGGRLYSDIAYFGRGTGSDISFDTWERGALFLARYTGNGRPLWVSSIQPYQFEVKDVLALEDGSAITAGRVRHFTTSPATFGAGEPGEVVLDVTCDNCPFLAHYLPDGTFDWVAHGDGEKGGILGLARATNGDYCTAGWFFERMVFDDGSPEGLVLEDQDGEGGHEGFVARFDQDGAVLWARAMRALEWTEFESAAALPDGSCAFSGFFRNSAVLDTGGGQTLSVDGGEQWSVLVAVYGAEGDLVWARDLGIAGLAGSGSGGLHGLASLEDDLVATGGFSGDLRAGTEDEPEIVWAGTDEHDRGLYVAKLRGSDGTRLWTATALGTTDHQNPYDSARAIRPAPDGGIVVGGGFTGSKTFGAGEPRETTLVSTGPGTDGFLAAYNDDGALRWAVRIASSPTKDNFSSAAGELVAGVDVNADGSILVSGQFLTTTTFGTGLDDAVVLESYGGVDAFVLRLDPNPIE